MKELRVESLNKTNETNETNGTNGRTFQRTPIKQLQTAPPIKGVARLLSSTAGAPPNLLRRDNPRR